jgi:hypothetical protein
LWGRKDGFRIGEKKFLELLISGISMGFPKPKPAFPLIAQS